MNISLLHPFTPQAAGVVENSVATYHSQPHAKALQKLIKQKKWLGKIEYLTPKLFKYNFIYNGLDYCFYPVSWKLNGDHKKWKKQCSASCLKAYGKKAPEVTIINMSGHSSLFSHKLAKEILNQGKVYIAMLGGQHYTDTLENRIYYKNAHHILVHTQLQKEFMQQLPMFEGLDVRVFPLGVDTDIFKPDKQVDRDYPQLLYVGRIVELKQVHLAIEALKLLVDKGFNNAKLTIIGPMSSESYLQKLKAMIKTFELEQHVDFLEHKPHAVLPDYFKHADLLLLPSDHESFGMVMIEAMSCGTPVAALKGAGGPDEVITHGVDGLLASSEDYAHLVYGFFKNKESRDAMGQAARKKVFSDYSLEKTCDVLLQSITDALNSL